MEILLWLLAVGAIVAPVVLLAKWPLFKYFVEPATQAAT